MKWKQTEVPRKKFKKYGCSNNTASKFSWCINFPKSFGKKANVFANKWVFTSCQKNERNQGGH